MNTYLRDHYEQCKEVIAIPDKYNKLTPKDHERSRRAGVGSKTHTLSLNTELPSRDEILKNKENKRQLNDLICKFDSTENAQFVTQEDCIAHHEEADITLISYMLNRAISGASPIILLSDDTDVFVLAVYWYWKKNLSCKVLIEKWDHTYQEIKKKKVTKLGIKCANILAVHALSGCDTVSFLFGRGKRKASTSSEK